MQVSRRVAALDGVTAALVAMATELNLELAAGMGFEVPASSPNELLVAVDARPRTPRRRAGRGRTRRWPRPRAPRRVRLRQRTRRRHGPGGGRAGSDGDGGAGLDARAATPFADAVDAVDAGLLTMVFSDNVPLEQEVALKEYAGRAGVLVMGPDCGTAVVGGVGLGFANVVRPGPVGIVAASGTGAQHLMALLDGAGVGVSHCLGVGGRDLSAEVAGRSTLRALDLLDADRPPS